MKTPVVFLLQFIAWLMLIAVLAATWAGVTYPNGRAKAYSAEFSKLHPMCVHRALIDDRYEVSTNLGKFVMLNSKVIPLFWSASIQYLVIKT